MMWLFWKKFIAYVLVLAAASVFGIELLPDKKGDGSVNREVEALLRSPGPSSSSPARGTPIPVRSAGLASSSPAAVSPNESSPRASGDPSLTASNGLPPDTSSQPSPEVTSPDWKAGGSASPAPASTTPNRPTSAATPVAKGRISLNQATQAQLMELPGIGETKAKAIIEYRRQIGSYRSIDELSNVKGIGEKTVERLRPFLTISER